ncbi:poly-gamma-glutamate synthesis protein (capsule biosynthesis protein) [Porphyromonadaceae bacterium NLAE-zl-C104]|nr:poly-gamma-glutamate synthesis protein (capsule biosynthesis protein) [Porphyromonadaceae bacterium NLAE-zl-C104]
MEKIKIAFLGDIMPGGILSGKTDSYISDSLLSYLKSFDLRIATLECAMGDYLAFDPVKMQGKKSIIYAKNIDIQKLVNLNIDAVSIANNHTFDLGKEGLQNTIELLKKNNILFFGAGMNSEEASKPVIIKKKNKSIALFGYCSDSTGYGYLPLAKGNTPGVNHLNINKVLSDIRIAKQNNDYVFVLPHWGMEHTYFPPVECKRNAYQMIKAGADGIIGGHPHRIQPLSFYKEKPIYYSLGNFLFPDRYLQPPRPVWYPPKDFDDENMPVTYGFPYVTEYTKKLWKPVSRIGMVAEVTLSPQIQANYRITNLSFDNKIDFFNDEKKYRYRLSLVGICVYSFLYYFEREFRRIMAKVRSIISR